MQVFCFFSCVSTSLASTIFYIGSCWGKLASSWRSLLIILWLSWSGGAFWEFQGISQGSQLWDCLCCETVLCKVCMRWIAATVIANGWCFPSLLGSLITFRMWIIAKSRIIGVFLWWLVFLFFVLIAEANHNSSSPIPASFVLNQTLYVTEYDPKYRYQVSYSPTGIICFQQSLSQAALSDPVHITAHAPLTFSSNIDSTWQVFSVEAWTVWLIINFFHIFFLEWCQDRHLCTEMVLTEFGDSTVWFDCVSSEFNSKILIILVWINVDSSWSC